jgi:hypothetical protein
MIKETTWIGKSIDGSFINTLMNGETFRHGEAFCGLEKSVLRGDIL